MELTAAIVRELLDYDPDTGILTWKKRDRSWFTSDRICNAWNSKCAGKEAFTAKSHGYRAGGILGQMYYAHRIIWLLVTGEWPDKTDHEDGDTENNRWDNLRDVDDAENGKNKRISSRNTSGATGVSLDKRDGRWLAHIHVNRTMIYLGLYKDFNEAVAARKAAEKQYGFHPNHGRAA